MCRSTGVAAYFEGHMGYRIDNTTNVPINDDPETIYMVASGAHYNDKCCFDCTIATLLSVQSRSGHATFFLCHFDSRSHPASRGHSRVVKSHNYFHRGRIPARLYGTLVIWPMDGLYLLPGSPAPFLECSPRP